MSKSERIVFSGKEEDFLYFAEQFEARIFHLKLNKVINREVDEKNFAPSVRNNATVDQREASLRKGREILDEKELHVWYELVQCLDKKSVLFLRPYKGKGSKAWEILCKRFKSAERPRLQQLISDLTSIRMKTNESVVDYITRAEELQYNLNEVDEGLSEKMFVSIILKGLPKEFNTFCTLVKFSKDDKSLNEIKKDLLNFESDHKNEKEETEHSFISRIKTCFRCNKTGHIAAHCRSKLVNKVNQSSSDRPPVKCFRCLEIGHIARDCKKEFERKSVREDQLLAETNETHFSFYNSAERVDSNLVIDSGATCSMIKDKNLFVELDQSFSETVENANKTESKVLGKGRVEFFVKDCQGNSKKISMSDCFYVPENSEKFSVSLKTYQRRS